MLYPGCGQLPLIHDRPFPVYLIDRDLRISPGQSPVVKLLINLIEPDIIPIDMITHNNILKFHFITC